MDASPQLSKLMATLQGAWKIVRVIEAGTESPRDEDDAQYLWFKSDVIVIGDEWAAWDMPYRIRVDRRPVEIDIQRDDRQESWLQPGILEAEGDTLRLCAAGTASHPRPEGFTSTEPDGNVLYLAQKCDEPLPD